MTTSTTPSRRGTASPLRGSGQGAAPSAAQAKAPETPLFGQGPLLTIAEAARVLNIPEGALRKSVSARRVPHTRLGKHVRFAPHHLAAIVQAGEQPTVAGQPGGRAPQTGRRTGARTLL